MQIYTIIGGVNGAGKSSLTGSLRAERTDLGIVVDPDQLTAQCGGDEYEGGKLAVRRIETALADGVNFTQETTLSGGYSSGCAAAPTGRLLYPPVLCRPGYGRKPAPHQKPRRARRPGDIPARMYRHGLHTACRCGEDPALLR